ncbi:MAG: DUF5916 domain-containing protein [Balneolaceae bacterium]
MKSFYFIVLSYCLLTNVNAQQLPPNSQALNNISKNVRLGSDPNPTLHAVRLTEGQSIKIDGLLDDDIWKNVPIATGFTQKSPIDGGVPTQRTEAQILYTDTEIYVGIMAYDTAPDSVIASLFRRDGNESSDWVYVSLDSYNDKRTAFTFGVNPKGVQKDILLFDDTDEDLLWDVVWDAEARQLDNGWSVEMRIPLSQLRFSSSNETHSWGINFLRSIARNNEDNFWAPISATESGLVSKFGRLEGIEGLKEPRRLEITPYTSARLTRAPKQIGNPYYKSNELTANIGGDIKYGLTSDLTLTATINPDFGQVEADPSTINLSQFETFFSERRPFFLEGGDIFRFGGTKTFNNYGNPNTFYSRRIGRAPQGSLYAANNYAGGSYFNADSAQGQSQYMDFPTQTSILGAAKVSGKLKSGTSIGVLYARTKEETAQFTIGQRSLGDIEGKFTVEPKSNYLVTRLKQDLNSGNTIFGGFFSGMNRDIEGTYFEKYLHNSALIAGVDFEHSWNDRDYTVSGAFSATNVSGSTDAITRTQLAPQRYYGRVDSDYLAVDTGKRSLGGLGTELSFKKGGGDHWVGSLTYNDVSPGYETNDIGFEQRADYRAISTGITYMEPSPKKLQYYEIWSNQIIAWNYDGDRINNNYNIGGYWKFQNLWSFNTNVNASFARLNDRITRGGPLMKYNDDVSFNFNINTNSSKKVSGGTGQFHRVDIGNEYDHAYWININYRPTTFIQVSLEPEISFENDEDQYIKRVADPLATHTYGNRYIFSDIKSVNLSASIRLNWTFTPTMSLQTYVRPFIASGKYSNFKEFLKPGTFEFLEYGKAGSNISYDGSEYTIDPDGGNPNNSFTIANQDFNYKSLQGNAVFRWEYRPGSTLFFVWQQQRSGSNRRGDFDLGRDLGNIFDSKPTNVFLVKLSYWFGT